MIGRNEAKEIGLPIQEPSEEIAEVMWSLYVDIADEMKLSQPWNVEIELGGQQNAKKTNFRGLVESRDLKHSFVTVHDLKRTTVQKDGMKFDAVQGRIIEEGWRQL